MKDALNLDYRSLEGLGLITMADQAGNRLNAERLDALRQALETALQDEEVRVIVLRAGAWGKSWCLGMDLDRLGTSLGDNDQDARQDSVIAYGELLTRISSCSKPIVAAIAGPVKAGGVGLAAACDMIVATDRTSFELSEVLFGLIPANVMPFLIGRRMSLQKARYLIMSAKLVEGQELLGCGLADEVYAPAEAESGLKKLLRNLLRAEPGALERSKVFSLKLYQASDQEKLTLAQNELLSLMKRPQLTSALQAFFEGNSPSWFAKLKTKEALFCGEPLDE